MLHFRRDISGIRTSVARALLLCGTPALLSIGFAGIAGPVTGLAKVQTANPIVKVEGPLANIVSSPIALTPAFDPSITDYVVRCEAGTNHLQFTLLATSGRRVNVQGNNEPSVVLQQTLIENQALIVDSHGPKGPGGTQYWIRCLPSDFPQINVTGAGTPPPGWYLTGNATGLRGGSTYAMVLDVNGTPVWYRRSVRPGALNVTLLTKDVLAWSGFGVIPNGAFEAYSLGAQSTRWISIPSGYFLDFHELHLMSDGSLMVLSQDLRQGVDVSAVGGGSNGSIFDCLVIKLNPSGQIVWQWRASDHIAVGESTNGSLVRQGPVSAYDVFHCNSVDTDPQSGDVLLSVRHTDAVYRIDSASGRIIWKLGGNQNALDGEQVMAIQGDPEGSFHAQHDARFQPNGDISLYDNQTFHPNLIARGVVYHISEAGGTATLVWSFQSPDGRNSAATGSFRRLYEGTDNVIGWGLKPNTLLTEVDSTGNILRNLTFPNGEFAYRAIKVYPSLLDHDLLRATAGLPAASLP